MPWNNFLNRNKIFVANEQRDKKENKTVKINQLELLLRQCTEHALTPSQLADLFPLARICPENVLTSRGMSQEEAQLRLEDKRKFSRKQRLLNLSKTTKTVPFYLNIIHNPFQLILLFSTIIYFVILLFSLFYDFEEENEIINGFNLTISNKQQQIKHFFTKPIISSIISVLLIQILFLFGIFILSKIFNPFKYLINKNSETLKNTNSSNKKYYEYYIAQRGGVEVKISEKEILPGDLIKLKAGQRVPVDCRILQVLEEPFIVDQSSIFQQNTIIELISKTSPNHLNVLEARNIVFAGFKCLNGEAFVIVLRTREETLHSKLNSNNTTKTKNIPPPPYYLTSTLNKENKIINNEKEEEFNKNKKQLKLLFGWPIVCLAILCSLIASLAFGYSLFLLLPSSDNQNNKSNWYQNTIQLFIPFVCTFIALLISILPYGLPLTLLIRQWYCSRYLACGKGENGPEFKLIKKQQNNEYFLNGRVEMLGNTSILVIHSNSLIGGNQPVLSDIWMASDKNNRHIHAKIFSKFQTHSYQPYDKETIEFIKMGVYGILKNLPLENNEITFDNNQIKPEYSALLMYIKELGISIEECQKEKENILILIGPPEEIFGQCSFIKEENNKNDNENKNNFVPLKEEHLTEFEEQFLRFCVQRKRCLALAVESEKSENLKNKNNCFIGLFAFEDIPLNIKYFKKLNKLMEEGPNIIFIGDEHPAFVLSKVMELNEKRQVINNKFNKYPLKKPFIIGNGTAKIENSENIENGNKNKENKDSFLNQLQSQLFRRLKNQKNVDFVSTSTTTSISTSTTLFNSNRLDNKIKTINGNINEQLDVFNEENTKWPIDGESFSQMSNKEIQQLFLEQFKSNKNNSGQNKFPLCFSRLNCEQITLIIKELQSIGHKVTFIVDLQNSMNESKAIKQSDFSVGIINYSNKFNYSYNYFDALIKCLEDGSGLVKLIIAIKEFGIGMKLTLIRSLTLTSSQASALLLPFLLSLTSDIPPIILPIHIVLVAFLFKIQYSIGFAFTPFNSKYHHHSLPIIYFNLILAGPFLAFSSLFNYWNTLYSTNIYLEPNNDVKEFFSPFSFNSTISSTVLKQQYNLKEASTIWLLTLLISQHLHIFICIIFSNVFYCNVMKRLKFISLWICIFLINILLIFVIIYLPGLRNLFELTPPPSQNLWWTVPLIFGIVFVFLNILFQFLLNNNTIKNTKFYNTILRWHNKQLYPLRKGENILN